MVDRIVQAGFDLFADSRIDDRIAVAEDDGTDPADPVDVLVAVDIPKPSSFGASRKRGRNAHGGP